MLEKIFIYVMLTFFSGILLFGAVSAVIFIPAHQSTGTVINKEFILDHDDSFWAGMWIPSRSGDSWKITVQAEEKTGSCRVTRVLYEALNVGDKVSVDYRKAWPSRRIDIENIRKTD